MPLPHLFGSAAVQDNFIGTRSIVARGPRQNDAVVGDAFVGDHRYFLTHIEHKNSPICESS